MTRDQFMNLATKMSKPFVRSFTPDTKYGFYCAVHNGKLYMGEAPASPLVKGEEVKNVRVTNMMEFLSSVESLWEANQSSLSSAE